MYIWSAKLKHRFVLKDQLNKNVVNMTPITSTLYTVGPLTSKWQLLLCTQLFPSPFIDSYFRGFLIELWLNKFISHLDCHCSVSVLHIHVTYITWIRYRLCGPFPCLPPLWTPVPISPQTRALHVDCVFSSYLIAWVFPIGVFLPHQNWTFPLVSHSSCYWHSLCWLMCNTINMGHG